MDQYKGSDVDKYRCFMSGEGEKNTKWRSGVPPNFDAVNKLFEEGRTKVLVYSCTTCRKMITNNAEAWFILWVLLRYGQQVHWKSKFRIL